MKAPEMKKLSESIASARGAATTARRFPPSVGPPIWAME
jgi:hypothetical protein